MKNRSLSDRYLDLMREALMGSLSDRSYAPVEPVRPFMRRLTNAATSLLHRRNVAIVHEFPTDAQDFDEGRTAIPPATAYTMIGRRRLQNLRTCIEDVLSSGVDGDLLEAGVWRGGAAMFMKAVLVAHADGTRTVWVADAFEGGFPPPDARRYPADTGDPHHGFGYFGIPLTEVKGAFERFGLLDDRVRFIPGRFGDTLPDAPVEKLAILRLDGDTYEATITTLDALYPKLSIGGYLIVDDHALGPCAKAVDDYRKSFSITEPVVPIDWTGVYWKRER